VSHPTGKGYFIWQLERCAGGDPARLADMSAAAGLSWVSFKIHNGTAPRNGDLSRHVRALADVGVASWGWGYCYGHAPETEAHLAIDRVQGLGLAGYMLNAEREYKEPGMATRATRAMLVFQTRAPGLPVGLCSYRYPSLHRTLPWREFLAGCTFHNPQVYWLETNDPGEPRRQLLRSLGELRAYRNLPVVPIGVASPNDAGTWRPTLAQIDDFNIAVRGASLPGVGWWSWEHAERRPDVWAAIARHPWAAPPSPPSPPAPSEPDLAVILSRLDAIELELKGL
jgi:hypothetical protein